MIMCPSEKRANNKTKVPTGKRKTPMEVPAHQRHELSSQRYCSGYVFSSAPPPRKLLGKSTSGLPMIGDDEIVSLASDVCTSPATRSAVPPTAFPARPTKVGSVIVAPKKKRGPEMSRLTEEGASSLSKVTDRKRKVPHPQMPNKRRRVDNSCSGGPASTLAFAEVMSLMSLLKIDDDDDLCVPQTSSISRSPISPSAGVRGSCSNKTRAASIGGTAENTIFTGMYSGIIPMTVLEEDGPMMKSPLEGRANGKTRVVAGKRRTSSICASTMTLTSAWTTPPVIEAENSYLRSPAVPDTLLADTNDSPSANTTGEGFTFRKSDVQVKSKRVDLGVLFKLNRQDLTLVHQLVIRILGSGTVRVMPLRQGLVKRKL